MKLPTNLSTQDLKNSRVAKWLKNFANSNVVAKFLVGLIIWSCALIPFWIYLIARWIAGPEGFWQELAILVICAIVIGWLQVILAIGAFILTIAVMVEDL